MSLFCFVSLHHERSSVYPFLTYNEPSCERVRGMTVNFPGQWLFNHILARMTSSYWSAINLIECTLNQSETSQILRREAHQLVGLGKTQRHPTLQSRPMFNQIQCVTPGDIASNRDRIMRPYAGRARFTPFCAVRNCDRKQLVMSYPVVLWAGCRPISWPRLSRSPEIRFEAVVGGICDRFF